MGNPYKAAFWVLLGFVLLAVLGSGALLFAGRAVLGGGERLEVERVTSPGGNTDAVLVQVAEGGGALGGANDELYLVPAGEEDLSGRSFQIDELDGRENLELRWRSEGLLEVRYPAAIIREFYNYAYVEREGGEPYVVELRLVPPEDEFSLPEGLLDDLPGRRQGAKSTPAKRRQGANGTPGRRRPPTRASGALSLGNRQKRRFGTYRGCG